MEDKIEVGEYVRTEDGEIHKVIKIIEDDGDWDYYCCENNAGYFAMDIANHSKELIDLIEVGDIVKDKYNKYEVAFVKDDKIYCNDYNLDDSLITLREQDIKAILAREQFEANCYKVGGEDEC